MRNTLSSLRSSFCHPDSSNHIVQSLFAKQQQVFTSVPFLPSCLFKVAAKLPLAQAVTRHQRWLTEDGRQFILNIAKLLVEID